MTINMNKNGATLTMMLDGRLDGTTAKILEQAVEKETDGISELIIDLEKLEYISSAGLRVLLAAQRKMKKSGSMKVIHAKDMVMEVLDITGFCDILTVCP